MIRIARLAGSGEGAKKDNVVFSVMAQYCGSSTRISSYICVEHTHVPVQTGTDGTKPRAIAAGSGSITNQEAYQRERESTSYLHLRNHERIITRLLQGCNTRTRLVQLGRRLGSAAAAALALRATLNEIVAISLRRLELRMVRLRVTTMGEG
jgi:hypothetical protein